VAAAEADSGGRRHKTAARHTRTDDDMRGHWCATVTTRVDGRGLAGSDGRYWRYSCPIEYPNGAGEAHLVDGDWCHELQISCGKRFRTIWH